MIYVVPSTSFALSRECYGFKLFQCMFLSCDIQEESNEVVNSVIYVNTNSCGVQGWHDVWWFEVLSSCWFQEACQFQGLWRDMLRLTLWSECSSRSMFTCMLRLTLWSHCIRIRASTSAWHCGVIVCLYAHVFQEVQDLLLWSKRLFNVQFNSLYIAPSNHLSCVGRLCFNVFNGLCTVHVLCSLQ